MNQMNPAEILMLLMYVAIFALALTVAYRVCMHELRVEAERTNRPAPDTTGKPRQLYIYDLRQDWQKGKRHE